MNIILINVRYNDLIIIKASNITMISFNNSFEKKFILDEISYFNKDIDWESFYMDIVNFTIEIINKSDEKELLYDFNFRIDDSGIVEDKATVNGIPIIEYDANNYNQHVIDIFAIWSKNNVVDFLNLDKEEKKAYNSCCRIWNYATNKLNNNFYEINISLIKSDIDFFNVMGDLLLGERGYMGYDSYTFEDRLRMVINNIEDRTIIELKNYQNLESSMSLNEWKYVDKAFRKEYSNLVFIIN